MMSTSLRGIACCTLVLWVGGCATVGEPLRLYAGPARAPDSVATLSAPKAIELLALDGSEVDLRYGGGGDYRVTLLPGPHTLGVVYREFWGTPLTGGVVVSDVHFLSFDAVAGARYQLAHDAPRDIVSASRHWDRPKVWLVDAASRRIDAISTEKYVPALFRAMLKRGSQPEALPAAAPVVSAEDRLMQADALARLKFWWKLAALNHRTAFGDWLARGAPPEGGAQDAPATALPDGASAEALVMQQDALKHLKFWWRLAGASDRMAFRAWQDRAAPAE